MSNIEVDTIEASSTMDANLAPATNYAADFNQAVCRAIERCKQSAPGSSRFSSPDKLTSFDAVRLLRILMFTRSWSDNMDMQKCIDYLTDRQQLQSKLEHVYATRAFSEMLNDADMPPEFQNGPSEIPSMGGNLSLESAFKEPYLENVDEVFIQSLNEAREFHTRSDSAEKCPYNWSIAVIQSSGTGKSRMMEQVGNKVFTIPVNLRQQITSLDETKKIFPPDGAVRNYFGARTQKTNEEQQGDYAVFLLVLFDMTTETIMSNWPWIGRENLPLAWARYMRDGLTRDSTGDKRRCFYAAVRKQAEKLRETRHKGETLASLKNSLRQSCDRLAAIVHPEWSIKTNAFLVCFDQADILTVANNYGEPKPSYSAYRNLGAVLALLNDKPVFFVFISRSSQLIQYAPPPIYHPSLLVFDGSVVIPPFSELPFDLYEKEVLHTAGPLTLENMSKVKAMVGFGRPLWYDEYKFDPTANIIYFAIKKLSAGGVPERERDTLIAALGIRIGISFDSKNANVVDLESRLVNSHMRVLYAINQDRTYMHTGSPSEPILAEAAARYLNGIRPGGLPKTGPELLVEHGGEWMIASGERAKLVGRLLVTCAYDIALKMFYKTIPGLQALAEPRHHKPVPLLDWLCALFGQQYHDAILDATPMACQTGSRTLKEQFSEAYIFFSHFGLADDQKMLSGYGLASALLRGMALECKDNQVSVDAVIPIHMGSLETPISVKTCSAINLQFKNRKQVLDCPVGRTITVPGTTTPTISIIFELGAIGQSDVTVVHEPRPVTHLGASNMHPDDQHYMIAAYGCNPTLFGAIPPEAEANYKSFLGRDTIVGDFARNHIPENLEALRRMNPSFSGQRQEERYSEWFV
ncbi:Serine/threonine-protein kinase [Ceratobasidium sp. AG-Ba]|nr:Serine/threonine-protein kinase [Ceratobasidium sp. AG-Ba]